MIMKMTAESTPLIVAFVADLMFGARIGSTAQHLGFQARWVASKSELGVVTKSDTSPEAPGEALHGIAGKLFQEVTRWQPALMLFDLANEAVPWQQWIPILKSSPATRRIPILCFGPHVNADMINEAKRIGADAVFPRSRFAAKMPELLTQYARIQDHAAVENACQKPLADLAERGIELFNQGEYYRCHDDLEAAWRQDTSQGRGLYRSILQVGIALYQVRRNNYRGAMKMLLRVRQWLAPLPDTCRGVDIAAFRHNVETIHTTLLSLGPDQLHAFDWGLVQKIKWEKVP